MAKSTLDVEERQANGSNSARRLRRDGMVPGNVYGLDRPPFPVQMTPQSIDKVLALKSGQNTVLTLQMSTRDVRREVIIRDLQRDPVTDRVIHVDFLRIDPTKAIEVQVPVELKGVPVGVRIDGGILDVITREVTVSCLPKDIPDELSVDISELHVNQHVSVSDLKLGEGVTMVGDAGATLAVVVSQRAEEESPAEGGGEGESAGEAESAD